MSRYESSFGQRLVIVLANMEQWRVGGKGG
jgi:hypothetical protein